MKYNDEASKSLCYFVQDQLHDQTVRMEMVNELEKRVFVEMQSYIQLR